MESGIFGIFLRLTVVMSVAGATLWSMPVLADQEPLDIEPLVVREVERRPIEVDRIDTEDFEIGAYGGYMNFEDFGSDTSVGIRMAYHVTEDLFVEATYGESELGETSFELLSGGARLLSESEREVSYYNVSMGLNLLQGESFVTDRWAFKGSLYLLAGAGSTEFGGDDLFTINAGLGYRFVAKDWLALHVTVRDHMFETDLLGESETKHNVEVTGSVTFFF